MKRARWIHISSSAPQDLRGGVQSYVDRISRLMSTVADHSIIVARLPPSNPAPLPSTYLGIGGRNRLARIVEMVKALWTCYSVRSTFFVHYLPHYVLGPRLWFRRNVVFVFHGPASLEARAEKKSKIYCSALHAIEVILYSIPRRFICLSSFSKSLLVQHYGVRPSRITVIPGPLEGAVAPPVYEKPRSETVRLLSVRRLVKRMGLERAIEAVSCLEERGYSVELRIVGLGPEKDALETLGAQRGINLTLLGKLDDAELEAQYRWADVFVLPTVSLEGFGMVILEAVQRGLPVVGTPVGAIPEVISQLGHPNIVARSIEPDAIADAISACIQDLSSTAISSALARMESAYGHSVIQDLYKTYLRSMDDA